ncbi:hypothetical protein LJ739_01895 [Aestuariibacter halophilus]|uniref:Uncharacterized protein n=1 Tax=Fluctibacter halophilus TaxID=226011 RepID=A0ABS8G323_9ALTE|nr:hypothetical protein [Aestuariibacter halophilus]MCC2614992.1 hypothetical protein [Aestuariibacter halophilus]
MANEMVNPQIANSIQAVQQATLTGDIIRHAGAGKAYQSVSQSTAIAVQDATDQLRNLNTISTTAAGVAISQMLATGNVAQCTEVLTQLQTLMTGAAENFKTIGSNAGEVLSTFPTGD